MPAITALTTGVISVACTDGYSRTLRVKQLFSKGTLDAPHLTVIGFARRVSKSEPLSKTVDARAFDVPGSMIDAVERCPLGFFAETRCPDLTRRWFFRGTCV
jgi:hypothetical protein